MSKFIFYFIVKGSGFSVQTTFSSGKWRRIDEYPFFYCQNLKKKKKISEQMIQNKYHAHAEDSGTKKELEYLRKGKTM